jgi:hypothetical protein
MTGELIFHIGIIISVISVIAGAIAAALLWLFWRKLSLKLDDAFGKERR